MRSFHHYNNTKKEINFDFKTAVANNVSLYPMKILLTHAYFLADDLVEQKIMMPYPPLGLLSVSAWLDQNTVEHEVWDTTFMSQQEFYIRLKNMKPDIIAVSVNLMTKLSALKITRFIRSDADFSQTRIVLGGPDVRYNAEEYLSYAVDFIVAGEGESTFLELCIALRQGKDISQVKGLYYRNSEKETIFTGERQLLADLDLLPFPARERIDMNLYFDVWRKQHGYATVNMSSMRGCPYSCKWCSKSVFGNISRRRSPESVVTEIEILLQKYPFEKIWFVDDVFTLDHEWIRKFAGIIEQKQIKISYEIITRADRLNEEVATLLKKSGCFRVWIGLESGSQRILDSMNRKTEAEDVRRKMDFLKILGVECGTFIMLGYPGETISDICLTIRHLKACLPLLFTIGLTYAINGTVLWKEVENSMINKQLWDKCTDRDIDFKRTYSRRFYNYALRWVYNEVEFSRSFRSSFIHPKTWIYKAKAITARIAMMLIG